MRYFKYRTHRLPTYRLAKWNSSSSPRQCSVYSIWGKLSAFSVSRQSPYTIHSPFQTRFIFSIRSRHFCGKAGFFIFISKMNFGLVPHVIYGSRVESTKTNFVDFRGHFFDIWQSDTHTAYRMLCPENERDHWQCFTVRNILLYVDGVGEWWTLHCLRTHYTHAQRHPMNKIVSEFRCDGRR